MKPQRLSVIVDGAAMADEEARALWNRFSEHMDANAGDLAGFAKKEGFASVHPQARNGAAVLVVSRTSPQLPYGSKDAAGSIGGSPRAQGGRTKPKRNR